MKFPLFLLISCLLWASGLKLVAADAPYIVNTIGDQSMYAGGNSITLDVSHLYALNNVSGPLVEFNFTAGKMYMELFPSVAPLTVANFLNYTGRKLYDDTFIHRSIPSFIIQGGGYEWSPALPHIPVYAPVKNEFQLSNLPGTVAMAKLAGSVGDPNTNLDSATSEWFVNLVDNSGLDGVDKDGIPLKFTVFGRLIGNGLAFAQSITALPAYDISGIFTPSRGEFTDVPLINYTSGDLLLANLVHLLTVKQVPLVKLDDTTSGYLSLTTSSSNTGVMTSEITSSGLKLTSVGSGDATITLLASDNYGNTVGMSFDVHSLTPSYAVAVKASPTSYGTVKGAKTALAGTKITVKATPKSKRKFKKWTESGKTVSTKATYSFTLAKQRSLVAVFSK